ncbi:MAG TPA: stage II sporulation protein M [Candidatus Binatia bacterium]|jgi:stage II sporulation protein M
MIAMPAEERRAYLKRLYPYLKTSLVIFGSGIVIGLMAVSHFPLLAQHFESSVVGFVKNFRGLSKLELAAAIFLNNTLKTVLAILLGSLFGIIPAVFLLGNGIALGVIFSLSAQTRGLWLSLLSIVPHGLLELPAVFLGTSIGLMVGSRVMKQFFRPPETTIGSELVQGLRFFITVILPLLFIAALVEAFLTSALITPR